MNNLTCCCLNNAFKFYYSHVLYKEREIESVCYIYKTEMLMMMMVVVMH